MSATSASANVNSAAPSAMLVLPGSTASAAQAGAAIAVRLHGAARHVQDRRRVALVLLT